MVVASTISEEICIEAFGDDEEVVSQIPWDRPHRHVCLTISLLQIILIVYGSTTDKDPL